MSSFHAHLLALSHIQKPAQVTSTLKITTTLLFNFFCYAWHSSLWWCITIPSLVTKGSAVQKILSGWTLTEILTVCFDLGLKHSNQIFHWTFWLLRIYSQTKFGCKRIISAEDRVKKKKKTRHSLKTATHFSFPILSGQWWSATIPNLVTTCWVVQ